MNYLDRLEKDISNKRLFEAIINNMNETERNVNLRIFENSRKYFKNVSKILTISNSKTVLSFLTQLHNTNKKLKVIIAESRPKNEGRLLAKRLIGEGICVEYVTDFSIANYIPGIEAAIIGADKILANGNVVNKTGSKTLAVLCRHFKKPIYVIASKSKLVSEINYIPEGRDPSEVWKYSDNNLTIRNYYFEEVEKNLITKIITD